MPKLAYRFRIFNADDSVYLLASTIPGIGQPYIEEAPTGDGQSLNPRTGEVTVGSYRVRIIDERDTIELLPDFGDGTTPVDDDNLDAEWPITRRTAGEDPKPNIGTMLLNPDGFLLLDVDGNVGIGDASGECFRTHVFPDFTPGAQYRCRVRILDYQPSGGPFGGQRELALRLNNDTGGVGYGSYDVYGANLQAVATANGSGEITVDLGEFSIQSLDTGYTALFSYPTFEAITPGADLPAGEPPAVLEGRIVTSRLTDAQARQHLLSRVADLYESEDEGDTWKNIETGYINGARLINALVFEFTIGESRRIEQTTKIFETIEDPVTLANGVTIAFDRASCILGGPIIGDFGPFQDAGRPRFQVTFRNSLHVYLAWKDGYIYRPISEQSRPLEDHNRAFLNALAQPYLGYLNQKIDGFEVGGAPFADLAVRLFALDTGPGVTENYPAAIDKDLTPIGAVVAGTSITEPGLLNSGDAIKVYWPVTPPPGGPTFPPQPALDTRFRLACFPRTISETNPLHVTGHPVDLAAAALTLRGFTCNAASAAATKAALGDSLLVELRITGGVILKAFLETRLYGLFGFAARTNAAGELEFFPTRQRAATLPTETITRDVLTSDEPLAWEIAEETAINKVTVTVLNFQSQPDDVVRSLTPIPIDFLLTAAAPYEAVPDETEGEVFGDKAISYDIPGRILGVDMAPFVAALGATLFDFDGRGAVESEFAVLRDTIDAVIGEEVLLDVAHLPTASPAQSPTSQRGTVQRVGLVVRRTEDDDGPLLKVQDRGLAVALEDVLTFTIAPSVAEPRKVATVEITSDPETLPDGAVIRVEMATGASPSGGTTVRLLDPTTDALTFDLPPVDAGAVVWARMRVEVSGQLPGPWTAFNDADLTDLLPVTDLAGTVSGTQVALTWTLGETDMPVEILLRLDVDSLFDSVILLPIASTQYTLVLPEASTDWVIGVRHREAPPWRGVSPTVTLDVSSDVAEELAPPIDPAVFSDGAGTYGLEVTAVVLPGSVDFAEAIETAVGSNTPGTYADVGAVIAVAGGRTRITLGIAPNDGKQRYLKARSLQGAATPSEYTTPLGVFPWLLLPPIDPVPEPDPGAGILPSPIKITLFGSTLPAVFTGVGAAVAALGPESMTKFPLGSFLYARVVVVVVATTLPIGAYVVAEYEVPEDPGTWLALDTGTGPQLAVDPTSRAGDLEEAAAGESVLIADLARQDVRLRASIAGGDADAVKFVELLRVDLDLLPSAPAEEPPPELRDPPVQNPGSCDVPGTLDDFAYADLAALDAAWVED